MTRGSSGSTTLKVIAAAICLGLSAPASAWALKTHLWISEKILEEVKAGGESCKLGFGLDGGNRYALNREVCLALKNHPAAFRAGVLGPDVFPDFIVGQVTTHPGTNAEPHDGGGKWTTGQYLSHLMKEASTPEELAFAYGYLVHAAGDVFAHTYVNHYAGDTFQLMEYEHRVETRHFKLEKYIERFTEPSLTISAETIQVPTALVANKLILHKELRKQYEHSLATKHLQLMHDLIEEGEARDDTGLRAKAHKLVKASAEQLEKLIVRRQKEERKLHRAEQQLALRAKSIKPEEALLGALGTEKAIGLVRESTLKAKSAVAAHAASSLPPSGLQGAAAVLGDINDAPDDAQGDIASIRELDALLGKVNSTGQAASIPDSTVAALLKSDALVRAASGMARLHVQQHETNWLEAARENLWEAQEGYIELLRQRKAQLDRDIAELQEFLKTATATRSFLEFRNLVRDNRIQGMRLAAAAYVDASMAAAIDAMHGETKITGRYQDWAKCWSMVFGGVPYQWAKANCTVAMTPDQIRAEIRKDYDALIDRMPDNVRQSYNNAKFWIDEKYRFIQDAAWNKAEGAFKDLHGGQMNIRFLKAATQKPLPNAQDAAADLSHEFLVEKPDEKSLVLIPNVANMINQDIGLQGTSANLEEFQALRHSLMLAKLALLDLDTVNRMVADHVGSRQPLSFRDGTPLYPRGGKKTSILPLMVKSIDGNHQWQAYGVPYPRRTREAIDLNPDARRFGYNAYRESGVGMRLFADPTVRKKLFTKLFPTSFEGAIQHYLREQDLAPFTRCAKAFPVTTLPDGSPAEKDDDC